MIYTLLNALINLFFPTNCTVCKNLILTNKLMCSECSAKHIPPKNFFLKQGSQLIQVVSLFEYRKPFKHFISSKFFQNTRPFALVADLFKENQEKLFHASFFDNSILVPIPSHWTRKFFRGFNQTEIFAENLAKEFKLPCINLISRTRATNYQAHLNKKDRQKNLHGAFEINTSIKLENKKIILVDDLCTSGTTLKSAASLLSKFGFESISAVTICHQIY